MEMKRTPKALDTGHRPWMHLTPRAPACDCLVDVILTNRGADARMDFGGQVRCGGGPGAQRERHGHHPWPRRAPGEDLFNEMRRHLGHGSPGSRGAKAAPLAAEGQQQLLLAGVTTEPQKAVRQDTTPHIVVKCALDIGGQACSLGGVSE